MRCTSASVSLAALERLVHADTDLQPDHLVALGIDVDDELPAEWLDIRALPREWREYPTPASLTDIGTRWLRDSRTAILSVPSAVIPHERNYVLNPAHADFRKLEVRRPEPFSFDPRLWSRRK